MEWVVADAVTAAARIDCKHSIAATASPTRACAEQTALYATASGWLPRAIIAVSHD